MFSDAPIDLKIKSHMICDLLNLCSFPCADPSLSSSKQQRKTEPNAPSDAMKKVRFVSPPDILERESLTF